MPRIVITDVRAICTAPDGIRLVVVKVETSEPGLYGLGCATFTQRPLAVVAAIEQYLKPFVVGRDPNDIEDIWQAAYVSSYWRNGPVLHNALSGIDMALWDIKGKLANMPLYQLFGGKCRQAAALYAHASGRDFQEVEEDARRYMEMGYRYVRCQVAVPGQSTYGARGDDTGREIWEPSVYCRLVPRLFDYLRSRLGEEVELLHDVHERVPPIQAVQLAKDLEPYRLFFLEDPFAPEDIEYFRILRQQAATPIAMGELFVNPSEYVPLIRDRLIDFIRVHISAIGGLSMARKLAAFCEFFGVRTAWHGPGDVSPVGHAANLHLDLACYNFGIQEQHVFGERTREVFPGCPEIRDGMLWPNDKPGLGVDIDEKLAARYPFPEHPLNGGWAPVRRLDGTVIRP
ncbi:starvation-sensing protein RspA [Thermomicrobiaceae bacterium CFH 74404]|uniref:Starvation-sensing protein RspA n=1 Tax=Thermalbibacter longus TaxID=2951981 RepID=A0AA41WGM0_9BACT|nr:enolase C-terminal domain-like protein [Thermalbibacter longus]MCM8750040.1 starvation-sensing protein RspA [Thermalbibacter longus]